MRALALHEEQYRLWTEQLVVLTKDVISRRRSCLQQWQEALAHVSDLYGDERQGEPLLLTYQEKRTVATDRDLRLLQVDEQRARRSLFGPHLDDVQIAIYGRNGRTEASRGQQKLALMLLKIAQVRLLSEGTGGTQEVAFLVDDFLTDFDEQRVGKLLGLLMKVGVQLVVTSPQRSQLLHTLCAQWGPYRLLMVEGAGGRQDDQIAVMVPQERGGGAQEVTG